MTAQAPDGAAVPGGGIRWRRWLAAGLLGVLGVLAAVHVLGAGLVAMGAAGLAGLVLAGAVIYRLPHLRRHFANPNGHRQRRWSAEFRRSGGGTARRGSLARPGGFGRQRPGGSGGGGKSSRILPKLRKGRGKGGGSLNYPNQGGRPKSKSGILRRKGGAKAAGTGMRPRRSSARPLSPSRARSGLSRRGGAGSRPGVFRRPGGRSGTGSRRRAGSGQFRGAGRGLPRFRGGSRGSGTGRRAGTGTRRAGVLTRRRGIQARPGIVPRRRVRTRPATAGRKPGTGGASPGRPAARRRRLSRPGTWFRRHTPSQRASGPRTRPRGHRRQWRRPSTWRRPRTATAPVRQPGALRRAWARFAGTPQQRANRLASRARVRAVRRRRAANPYARRSRWYAPWRRQRSGRVPGRIARPRPQLTLTGRARRRWNIARGRHQGLGIGRKPLRARLRAWRYRNTSRQVWGQRWAAFRRPRRRPLPRPLAAAWQPWWLGTWTARLDRRRQDRWMQRHRRNAPVPSRRPAWRPGGLVPEVAGHVMTSPDGSSARGGFMADTMAMADEIRTMGGGEFAGPEDVHEYLQNVHQLVEALRENLSNKGLELSEMGVHPAYPEAIQEAAGMMTGIADQLEQVTAGGVMRGPGG